MKRHFARAFVLWLPLIVGLTGVFGFAYVAVQQDYRQSANDPQIQMAEDAASLLGDDYTPPYEVLRNIQPIEISKSLAPWMVIYDASGTPLAEEVTSTLDGAPPHLPAGLFDTTTWVPHKIWQTPSGLETRVTWQPRADVRQAVVLVQFDTPQGKEWIAVGRSLRTTEERISNLTQLAAVAWSVTVLASFAAIFITLFLGWL